jgi:hypothetical protein
MTPRYRYLGRTYVDTMGLPVEPVSVLRSQALSHALREPRLMKSGGIATYHEGVVFEGHLYLRDSSGLSYDYHGPARSPR